MSNSHHCRLGSASAWSRIARCCLSRRIPGRLAVDPDPVQRKRAIWLYRAKPAVEKPGDDSRVLTQRWCESGGHAVDPDSPQRVGCVWVELGVGTDTLVKEPRTGLSGIPVDGAVGAAPRAVAGPARPSPFLLRRGRRLGDNSQRWRRGAVARLRSGVRPPRMIRRGFSPQPGAAVTRVEKMPRPRSHQ